MIDHHVILIFYIVLLPLSSIASLGFLHIFTIDSMQKCEHKVKGKDFLFEVKRVSYSLILYPEVGYMIVYWICLFVYLKCKFASTYLFLFLSITSYNTSA